jgi:glycerophosphoryl diester phosphodiesterase
MTRFHRLALIGAVAALALSSAVQSATPLVLGHRGAPAYVPEHTLASYLKAIELGADYIEPDLVSTKDGVLIARHEPYLGGDNAAFAGADSTNVASHPEFASRKKTIILDGVSLTGWFAEDFTLAEIKTLRANERLPTQRLASAAQNGLYEIPTLQEVINLAKAQSIATGRTIGIYPETKHPTYHDAIGLSLEEPLVATLLANGYDASDDAIFVQSFEVANLIQLNAMIDVPLIQLLSGSGKPYDFTVAGDVRTYADLATAAGLATIATYADGIGPTKGMVIPVVAGALGAPTSLVADAHAVGLDVHPYTFRPENPYLPSTLRNGSDITVYGNDQAEYLAFFNAGVDGVFSDAADRARSAVTLFSAVPEPATWGLMLTGFGLIGGLMRRRSAIATA